MKSDKTIRYNCRYKKQVWKCEIRNIKKINEITSFSISGRKRRYDIYLIQLGQERWIGIPEINVSSPLSTLDDIFWNSERIGNIMHSIIDGVMIAEGLKLIYENAV